MDDSGGEQQSLTADRHYRFMSCRLGYQPQACPTIVAPSFLPTFSPSRVQEEYSQAEPLPEALRRDVWEYTPIAPKGVSRLE